MFIYELNQYGENFDERKVISEKEITEEEAILLLANKEGFTRYCMSIDGKCVKTFVVDCGNNNYRQFSPAELAY